MPLQVCDVLKGSFTGIDSTGGTAGCALSGARVGDVVVRLTPSGGTTDWSGFYEAVISVDDQIQQPQGDGNFTSHTFDIFLFRPVAV